MSPVEIISKVKKKSSLDFFRISGCCYGYCDYSVIGGFSEWIKYDWLLQLSYCSQLSYYIVWLQLYRMIREKNKAANAPIKFEEL